MSSTWGRKIHWECKIICKEIRIQVECYSANHQLDSADSERDFMQAGEGDLMIINCTSDREQGQWSFDISNDSLVYIMGDSRKYPYPTTSLPRIFVSKLVIWQGKDNFWPDKKPVWSDNFFLSSEIKNKRHLRHFHWYFGVDPLP